MIRILQCVNNMHRAGLETMLMNYYRNIDRTRIQFDFLTHRPERSDYDDEIESLGGKIYRAPRLYPQNYPEYFRYMERLFSEHPEYKIVHSHIDAMSYLPLLAAKKAGIPVRIAHSHNTAIDFDFKYPLKQFFRMKIVNVATHFLSCGNEAGNFLFRGRPFKVIPNAIDAEAFLFDESVREKKRNELNVNGNFVIGHVGRLSYQKNHEFLLKIFFEILKTDPTAVLLLIGTGENKEKIEKSACDLNIIDQVHFLGNRSDVFELYQAMDAFLLPSRFEGLPVVGIEAQFSGLPCVFSDAVPKEVAFTEQCQFVSLKTSSKEWARIVLDQSPSIRQATLAENSVYNIKNAHTVLEDYYLELLAGR